MFNPITLCSFAFVCLISVISASDQSDEDSLSEDFTNSLSTMSTPSTSNAQSPLKPELVSDGSPQSPKLLGIDPSDDFTTMQAAASTNNSPLQMSPDHEPKSPSMGATALGKNVMASKILHVLVADDCRVNRSIISRHLTKLGHTFVLVENGREALAAVSQNQGKPFDLLLTDVEMPDMSGPQAAAAIREISKMPIIGVTASEGKDQECLDSGMDVVLHKPLTAEIINNILRPYVSQKLGLQ